MLLINVMTFLFLLINIVFMYGATNNLEVIQQRHFLSQV